MLPNDSELLHLYLLAEIVIEKGTKQITPLPAVSYTHLTLPTTT